jgi:hypothetical protein
LREEFEVELEFVCMVDFVNEALRAIGEECEGVVDFAFHVIGAGYRPARVEFWAGVSRV